MTKRAEDVRFPECCTLCPHLQPVSASCGHDLRQSVIWELDDADASCPVYREERADAMRELSDALRSS